MAEAALSVVLKSILGSLSDPAIKEMKLLCCVKKEQEKLGQTLSTIETTLNAVENGEYIITEPVKAWLGQLKDVLYDADDVMDDFRTEALIRKMEEELHDSWIEKVCSFLSCCSNSLAYFWKMGHRIKDISERLDNIEKNRTQFEPRVPHNLARLVDNVQQQRETDSSLPSGVIGRDGDKEEIVKLLMDCGSEDADENISVIPIVGPGGIGKTTLAKMVFNDDRIKRHFELHIWVCVSDDFNKKTVIARIVELLTGEKCADLQMETLREHLGDKLDGKRYLLVLDDVWNEDPIKWAELKDLLISTGKEADSKILVTTRSKVVAKVVCPTLESYDLSFLPYNDSWYVFKRHALILGQETLALEKIGKQIVGKCGGLPLALRALGSLLYGNINEDDWEYVRDNEMWMDRIGRELDVLPILKFSYDNLPSSHIKHCFAYCSLFPKDDQISKQVLVKLWMAQGFLQSSDPKQRMEDIGNHYFNILLSRSFFQEVEEDGYGNIRSCKMHDLMHDLAQSVSGGECLSVDKIDTPIQGCVRHMFLLCDTYQGLFVSHKLRTFKNGYKRVEVSQDAWSSFSYIRALCLYFSDIQEQLSSISELKHLRYLDLSFYSVKKLPESVIKLQNLQTLHIRSCGLGSLPINIGKTESLRHIDISGNDEIEALPDSICKLKNLQSLTLMYCCGIKELPVKIGEIISLKQLNAQGLREIITLPESIVKLTNLETLLLKGCRQLEALPKDIGKMVSLRQLQVDWRYSESLHVHRYSESLHVPSGVGQLTRLQTSPFFKVGKDGDKSLPCLSELHGLNNLRDRMKISNLENATTSEAKEANLKKKQYLKSLILEWGIGGGDDSDDVAFLEALEPHRNLQELEIDGYGGTSFPPWTMKMTVISFPHLARVHLHNCRRCQNFPSLVQLPSLEFLSLRNLEELEYIKTYVVSGGNTKFFPSLKELKLKEMWKLREWSRIEETEDDNDEAAIATTLAAKTVAEQEQRQLLLLSFPCLSKLTIKDCPNFETMPFHPCVERLQLKNFSGNLLQSMMMAATPTNLPSTTTSSHSSFSAFENLKSLNITECKDTISLFPRTQYLNSFEHLANLEKLEMKGLPSLVSLPEEGLRRLTSLRSLFIQRCESLISLSQGMQHLTALEELSIVDCKELNLSEEDGIHGLQSLEKLKIENLPKLVSLPEGFQHATSLQSLHISFCRGLMSLPEWLGNLASLKELYLYGCPHLSRRCEIGVGEDWPKISHIPDVEIYGD